MARRASRRRSSTTGSPLLVGIGWYDATQWAKLKQVAADATDLDDSHADWQRNAEWTERELSQRGLHVRRVAIDVDALVAWCRERGKPINGDSRTEYTCEIVSGVRLT
jgi:hypothetical protein